MLLIQILCWLHNYAKLVAYKNSTVREKLSDLKCYNVIDTSSNEYTLPWCLHYLLLKVIVTFTRTNSVNQKLSFFVLQIKTISIPVLCQFTKKKTMLANNFCNDLWKPCKGNTYKNKTGSQNLSTKSFTISLIWLSYLSHATEITVILCTTASKTYFKK